MKNKNKGFTLIELLVVIAIIGILAAMVLVSLRTARDKAKDTSAIGSMSSIRAAAEIYYTDSAPTANTFAGVCDATSIATGPGSNEQVRALLNASYAQAVGGTAVWGTYTGGAISSATAGVDCNDSATAYAAQVLLHNTHYFCVDSTGFAGQRVTDLAAGTTCPTS